MYLINRLGEGFLSMWGGFSHEYTEGRPFLTRSDAEQARGGEHDLVVYIPAMLDGMPINERETIMHIEDLESAVYANCNEIEKECFAEDRVILMDGSKDNEVPHVMSDYWIRRLDSIAKKGERS